MSMRWMLICLVVVAVGCKENNSDYCKGHPNDTVNCPGGGGDGSIDTPTACTKPSDCSGAAPVCDTAMGVCVQCTTSMAAACTGGTPVCGTNDACRACALHAECTTTSACLPTGACGDDTSVAYVAPASAGGSVNTSCTKATPCTIVANALATNRPYIKISGTIDEAVVVNDKAVTFLADPGAKLTRTSAGVILTINGASPVTIYDLEIANALGSPAGVGIAATTGSSVTLDRVKVTGCAGVGISATTASLTATQSSILANTGGGISLASTSFDLTNNVIAKNGGGSTIFGGILISQLGVGSHILDFNTISGNTGGTGSTTGVLCNLVGQAITFSNNIIYGNVGSGAGTQVSGNMCSFTYSDIGPDTVTGTGNANTDPMFVNASQNNFHLLTGSLAKDAADPGAVLAIDLDGDARPQGTARDMGADEYK